MEKSLRDLCLIGQVVIVLSVQLVLAVFNAIQAGRQKNCSANDDKNPSLMFDNSFGSECFHHPFSNTILKNEQDNRED